MKQVKYKQQANVKSCQIRGRCIVFPDIQWNILTGHLPLENDSECSTSELQSFPLSPNHRTASPTKQTFYDIDECSQIFTCTIHRKIHTLSHTAIHTISDCNYSICKHFESRVVIRKVHMVHLVARTSQLANAYFMGIQPGNQQGYP